MPTAVTQATLRTDRAPCPTPPGMHHHQLPQRDAADPELYSLFLFKRPKSPKSQFAYSPRALRKDASPGACPASLGRVRAAVGFEEAVLGPQPGDGSREKVTLHRWRMRAAGRLTYLARECRVMSLACAGKRKCFATLDRRFRTTRARPTDDPRRRSAPHRRRAKPRALPPLLLGCEGETRPSARKLLVFGFPRPPARTPNRLRASRHRANTPEKAP